MVDNTVKDAYIDFDGNYQDNTTANITIVYRGVSFLDTSQITDIHVQILSDDREDIKQAFLLHVKHDSIVQLMPEGSKQASYLVKYNIIQTINYYVFEVD